MNATFPYFVISLDLSFLIMYISSSKVDYKRVEYDIQYQAVIFSGKLYIFPIVNCEKPQLNFPKSHTVSLFESESLTWIMLVIQKRWNMGLERRESQKHWYIWDGGC